jgi:hypothetical protein
MTISTVVSPTGRRRVGSAPVGQPIGTLAHLGFNRKFESLVRVVKFRDSVPCFDVEIVRTGSPVTDSCGS